MDVALGKRLHNSILFTAFHTSVQKRHTHLRESLLEFVGKCNRRFEGRLFFACDKDLVKVGKRDLFGFFFLLFDRRTNDIDLSALVDLFLNECIEARAVGFVHYKGVDSLSARGHFVNARNIEFPIQDKRQRARNGGSTHNQKVSVCILFGKACALTCTKTVLLVGDDKSGSDELHTVGKKRVCSNDHLQSLCFVLADKCSFDASLLPCGGGAHKERTRNAHPLKHGGKVGIMLTSQNFGGCHECRLSAVLYGNEHCGGGTNRLTASNVTNHNSAHRRVGCHIARNFVNRALLRTRQFIRECCQKT